MSDKSFFTQKTSTLSAFLTISILVLNTPIFLNSASALPSTKASLGGDGVVDKPELLLTPTLAPAPKAAKTTIYGAPVMKRVLNVSTLEGKITSTDYNAAETACSSVSISLNELIPSKTPVSPSNFGGQTTNNIARINATGSTLNNGCTYSLNTGFAPYTRRADGTNFELLAHAPIKVTTCSLAASKRFSEFSRTLDLSMVQSCLR